MSTEYKIGDKILTRWYHDKKIFNIIDVTITITLHPHKEALVIKHCSSDNNDIIYAFEAKLIARKIT